MKKENERLLHQLQESKSKERIYKFGLERFSSSSENIKFYTGFPDYPTLIEFWIYEEPSASDLTYYSYVRGNSDSIPYVGGKQKEFPGRAMLGVKGNYSQLSDELCLFSLA